jgi:DNA repair protein RecN (Recombination protein N)
MLEEALVRLEESAHALDALQGKVDLDPERLDEALSRLDLISRFKKKYGPGLEDVIAYRDKIQAELNLLENADERKRDLEQRLARAEKDLHEACSVLSRGRAVAAKKLAEAVQKEFKDLGLNRAELHIAVGRQDQDGKPVYAAHGYDLVEFLFTPNPGEGRQPLAAVASGGELSRIMLALKTVLAQADPVATLVFDEIDAGVGGTLGAAIGKKMAKLGKNRQVLCITHLASIAACAQTQFFVEKEVKGDRTRTIVKKLTEEERVEEIARMLGDTGEKSESRAVGLRHAKALLAELKI